MPFFQVDIHIDLDVLKWIFRFMLVYSRITCNIHKPMDIYQKLTHSDKLYYYHLF